MKIIIAGGGTGGHIFPAISIAEEALKRNPESRILFVGTRRGMEARTLAKAGYDLEYISSGGIVGRGFFQRLKGGAYAVKGFFDSLSVLRRFNPDAVIGVGGYASGPLVLAAWTLRFPTAVCEQNTVPGITNRILARFAKRVFASFSESIKYFPQKKTIVAGNPVRGSILSEKCVKRKKGVLNLLVLGGSQGAHKLNITAPEAFGMLNRSEVFVVHQTGDKDVLQVRKAYERHRVRAEVLAFIEDIGNAYREADLVIARAGAGTVAEVTALGKPSVLVPYPFSAYNHQMENARALERAGAAVVVEDDNISPEMLAGVISDLLDGGKLGEMAQRAKGLGRPDAARTIVEGIYELVGKR